jgi:peptidase E
MNSSAPTRRIVASGDSERYHLRFLRAFAQLDCAAETLSFFPFDMKRDYAQKVREADLVFVGGGNTVAMVAVWHDRAADDTRPVASVQRVDGAAALSDWPAQALG